ncbi:MAG: PP2C family protein-serine/threonine phosphatase [Vulcanimicrobiota bacterium]
MQKETISLVISDWMMPEMDGPELCRHIRAAHFPQYIYIIMLTARETKTDLIEGMESGADDFMVKPFNKDELRVRIKAGERVIKLERDLEDRNSKLSEAYSVIKKDLEAASKMQRSLLPGSTVSTGGVLFDWIFLPAYFLAGDIFNFLPLDDSTTGFYLLDVSGHGIPAALLSVTISHSLSPSNPQGSLMKSAIPEPPYYSLTPPSRVVAGLNAQFYGDKDSLQCFTMIYGLIDVRKGKITLTQAGHLSLIYVRKDGTASLIGTGGFPVGMLSDAEYEEHEIDIQKGDRIFIYSDGITECINSEKAVFRRATSKTFSKSITRCH